jgi:oligopeptide transport system ATP-binding protein
VTTPLLEVTDLEVTFRKKRILGPSLNIRAVDGVSLTVAKGETLGLVGESGCGKSTTARGLMRLVEPSGGSVKLNGRELLHCSRGDLRTFRAPIQMVFQDPVSSLSPRMTIRRSRVARGTM